VDLSLNNRGCLRIYAPKLNPEILNTNDLVELTTDSSFKFLGRIDNVINSGGLKIQPEILESLVKKTIDYEVVFLGVPDQKLGQKLVMAIEGQQVNVNSVLIDRVLNQIEMTYSKNQKPRDIIFINQFPRLSNGKIDRLTLQQDLSKSKY